jgi:hypothetical protein
VDRDEILEQINSIANMKSPQKYRPIVISTSRGMGKTFLLKMIGLQRVPASLKCQRIQDAVNYGRIISFDWKYIKLPLDVNDPNFIDWMKFSFAT